MKNLTPHTPPAFHSVGTARQPETPGPWLTQAKLPAQIRSGGQEQPCSPYRGKPGPRRGLGRSEAPGRPRHGAPRGPAAPRQEPLRHRGPGASRGGRPRSPPYRRWWCGWGRRAPGSRPAWTGARRAPGPAAAAGRCAGRRSPGPGWYPAPGSAAPGRRRRWSRWCSAPAPAPSSRCRCGPGRPRSRWGRGAPRARRPWRRCTRPVRPNSAPAATRAPPPPFRKPRLPPQHRTAGKPMPAPPRLRSGGTPSPRETPPPPRAGQLRHTARAPASTGRTREPAKTRMKSVN